MSQQGVRTSNLHQTFDYDTNQNPISFSAVKQGSGIPTAVPFLIPSYYVNTDDNTLWFYNTSWIQIAGGSGGSNVVVASNVSNIQTGDSIVAVKTTDPTTKTTTYTLTKSSIVTGSGSPVWVSTGTSSKDRDASPGVAVLSDIKVPINITGGTLASVASDTITFTWNGGTRTFTGPFIASNIFPSTDPNVATICAATGSITVLGGVTVNNGVSTTVINPSFSGMSNVSPVPFSVGSISASFSPTGNQPYWVTTATATATSNFVSGSITAATWTLTPSSGSPQTNSTGVFTGISINNTVTYTMSGSFTGDGTHGAATGTTSSPSAVSVVGKPLLYTPMFYHGTPVTSAVAPTFSITDTYIAAGYVINTSTATWSPAPFSASGTNYYWMAVPQANAVTMVKLTTALGDIIYQGSDLVTTTQTISGQLYNIVGVKLVNPNILAGNTFVVVA